MIHLVPTERDVVMCLLSHRRRRTVVPLKPDWQQRDISAQTCDLDIHQQRSIDYEQTDAADGDMIRALPMPLCVDWQTSGSGREKKRVNKTNISLCKLMILNDTGSILLEKIMFG